MDTAMAERPTIDISVDRDLLGRILAAARNAPTPGPDTELARFHPNNTFTRVCSTWPDCGHTYEWRDAVGHFSDAWHKGVDWCPACLPDEIARGEVRLANTDELAAFLRKAICRVTTSGDIPIEGTVRSMCIYWQLDGHRDERFTEADYAVLVAGWDELPEEHDYMGPCREGARDLLRGYFTLQQVETLMEALRDKPGYHRVEYFETPIDFARKHPDGSSGWPVPNDFMSNGSVAWDEQPVPGIGVVGIYDEEAAELRGYEGLRCPECHETSRKDLFTESLIDWRAKRRPAIEPLPF